jgi:hypothetical protein
VINFTSYNTSWGKYWINRKALLCILLLIPLLLLIRLRLWIWNFHEILRWTLSSTETLVPEKICPILEKRGTPPKSHRTLMKITPSDSAYQRTLLLTFQAPICKNVEFCIFCQKKDHACVFIFCCFFFRGDRIDPVVLRYRGRAHSNGN